MPDKITLPVNPPEPPARNRRIAATEGEQYGEALDKWLMKQDEYQPPSQDGTN